MQEGGNDHGPAVVSKQLLSDEFLNGYRACEETPKVGETTFCSETDVDAVWQVLFCLTEHDAGEDGEHCGGQNASLLDAVGDGEAVRQRPTVLHLTLLTVMELAENGEKFGGTAKARQDFPQSITADGIKDLGQVYENFFLCWLCLTPIPVWLRGIKQVTLLIVTEM